MAPITVAEPEALPLREARRRWAELLRRIYEVDPLTCPACGGAMRILAFLTERAVIYRILDHLRRTRADARGPPFLAPRHELLPELLAKGHEEHRSGKPRRCFARVPGTPTLALHGSLRGVLLPLVVPLGSHWP